MKSVFRPANSGKFKRKHQMSETQIVLEAGALSYTKAVTFTFRPQPLLDDENQSTKLEGVTYIEHETDRNGNVVYEDDGVTPKLLFSRKKLTCIS